MYSSTRNVYVVSEKITVVYHRIFAAFCAAIVTLSTCLSQQVVAAATPMAKVEGQMGLKNGKGWRANGLQTSMGMGSSITYAVALATRRTLGSGQTSVSLLSLLTGGSNQTNQTWVTL